MTVTVHFLGYSKYIVMQEGHLLTSGLAFYVNINMYY